LQATLQDLHDKYQGLKHLEDSVLELRDLFLYLAALVERQGEQLDSIEVHVENTREYTGQAVLRLDKAREYKQSLDRKKWMLWLLSFGVITVFVLVCLLPLIAPAFSALKMLCFGSGDNNNNGGSGPGSGQGQGG